MFICYICVGQVFSKLSLQSSLKSAPKIGVAIIVANDYANNQAGLAKLHGIYKDVNRMFTAFNKLGYEVILLTSLTYFEFETAIREAKVFQYCPSYKRLVFLFFGYGTYTGKLYTQEGNTFSIKEIFESFSWYKLPKLFFLNLCQKQGRDRFFSYYNLDRVCMIGNYLVVCSVLPYRELHSGSLWVILFADKILTLNEDAAIILDDVNNKLRELYRSLSSFDSETDLQVVNKLKESIKFLAESPAGTYMMISMLAHGCTYILLYMNYALVHYTSVGKRNSQ